MDDELVSIAHHEGGHVVAAVAFGRDVGFVLLDDDGGGAALVALTGYSPERLVTIVRRRHRIAPPERRRLEAGAIIALAGAAAEAKLAGCTTAKVAGVDLQHAQLYAVLLKPADQRAFLERCAAHAAVVVGDRWTQVRAIAHALLEKGSLSPDDVQAAIAAATPRLSYELSTRAREDEDARR